MKIMIEAATNGMTKRDLNPHVPYSPAEIAADARATVEAGASLIHFHVREADGEWSHDIEMYKAVMRQTRLGGCAPIMWPTFDGGGDVAHRFRHYTALAASSDTKPDVGTCDMASLNLSWWDESHKRFLFSGLYQNPIDHSREVIALMHELGLPQVTLQVHDATGLRTILKFLEMGILKEPLLIKFYFGGREQPFGLPPTPKSLDAYVDQLRGVRAHWFACCFGEDVIPLLPHAIAMGGHCRVGLEDHHYCNEGKASNPELVQRVVKIVEALGHEVATPAEARALLEI
jgi:3-keto-5-aminohexanoate cleavage enzyme